MQSALSSALVAMHAAVLACVAPSCSGGGETHDGDGGTTHTCDTPFAGDATKEPAIELVALGPNATSSAIADGGTVPLMDPPQGGRVIFAGVRATNLDPCGVELSGVLRDTTTKQIRLDTRTVNLRPKSDGWVGSDDSDISTFSNIPVCPNQWSPTNVYGTAYELQVTVIDSAARKATVTIAVTPTCAEPDREAECLCICQGGYMLGESCDGGVGGSSP